MDQTLQSQGFGGKDKNENPFYTVFRRLSSEPKANRLKTKGQKRISILPSNQSEEGWSY